MRFQKFRDDLISRMSYPKRFREFYFAKMAKIRETAKFNLAKINPIKVSFIK